MMKKIFYAISLLLAFSLVITSCSKEENRAAPYEKDSETTVTPVESQNVTDFFNTTLPNDGEVSQYFFTSVSPQRDICSVVNSRAEFEAIYSGVEELPEIDFEKYSLVIGMVMLSGGYRIEEFNLGKTTDALVVNLDIRRLDGTFLTGFFPSYYWGLYEKLPKRDITMNKSVK